MYQFLRQSLLLLLPALLAVMLPQCRGQKEEVPLSSPAASLPADTSSRIPLPAVAPTAVTPTAHESMPVPRSLYKLKPLSDEQLAEYRRNIAAEIAAGRSLSSHAREMLELVPFFHFKPDDVIADIGAGTGYFQLTLLEHHVPFGRIYAVDIDDAALDILWYILEKAEYPGRERVIPHLSAPEDVRLPAASLDVATVISSPFFRAELRPDGRLEPPSASLACLRTLHRAMKDGALLHVVEFNMDFCRDERALLLPLEQAGFRLLEKHDRRVFDTTCCHFVLRRE